MRLIYVGDIDRERVAMGTSLSGGAQGVADFRRILDDPSIDAETMATPGHWHVPAPLLALEAGKHVHVEKPCSHHVREVRMLVDVARRQNKVVQHGTRSRSSAVGGRRMLIDEQRLWSTTLPDSVDSGAEFHGTQGKLFLTKRGKIEVLGDHNRPVEVPLAPPKVSGAENQQNWIDCIRSGERPHADIEIAHRCATAVHLANIAPHARSFSVPRQLRFHRAWRSPANFASRWPTV